MALSPAFFAFVDLQQLLDLFLLDKTVQTAPFLLFAVIALALFTRWLRHAKFNWTPEHRLRVINNVRGAFISLIFVVLLFLWAAQLSKFILSFVGLALAIVVATKELILCVSGSTLRLRNNSYEVGDRIEFLNMRGDVMSVNLFSTTLLEVGPGKSSQQQTGRIISYPNSLLLSYPVINESLLQGFYIEQIKITLNRSENWPQAKEILLKIAQEECKPYLREVQQQVIRFERRNGLEFPPVKPNVSLSFSETNSELIYLLLRFPASIAMKGKTEQTVVCRFLEQFQDNKTEEN